jgi:ubiquinone/menaquinone biosynthesis C-methylase UbiE
VGTSARVRSQREKGAWRLLSVPGIYDAFQTAIGARSSRQRLVDEFIRARPGDRVLEVGCGTARMLDHFSVSSYVGIDNNHQYIADARRRYGNRGEFIVADVRNLSLDPSQRYDIVLALGLLHHIDDQTVAQLFSGMRRRLADGGRMVTGDAAFVRGQPLFARLMVTLDRGRHVRTPEEYQALARQCFGKVHSTVGNLLPHLPYTHCIMECTSE